MEKNIEIEFKRLLDLEHYNAFLPMFKNITPYVQINNYFDTKDSLLAKNTDMLRVRLKNNSYEFTLKRRRKVGLDEFNEMIDQDRYEKLKNGIYFESEILTILKEDGIEVTDLIPCYSLKTTRYDLPYQQGLLSLDRNEYLDIVDYELEYEVPDYDAGREIYIRLLNQYGLDYVQNCRGKRYRVLNRLQELQK